MDWMRNKTVTLSALGGGALCLLASWPLASPLLAGLAAVLFCASLVVWKWGYWLGPFFTRAARLTLSGAHYELPPSQDVLIRKTDSGYLATVYLSVQLRHSASFKPQEQQALLMEYFERAVSSLRYVVRLSVMVANLDTSDYVQSLEERRSLAEHKKSQLRRRQSDEAERLSREIESHNAQLRALTAGQRPMQVLAFASTTAAGLTREEALSRARAQGAESAAVLSNALSCDVQPLSGEELLRCFEWERQPPASKEELHDATF